LDALHTNITVGIPSESTRFGTNKGDCWGNREPNITGLRKMHKLILKTEKASKQESKHASKQACEHASMQASLPSKAEGGGWLTQNHIS